MNSLLHNVPQMLLKGTDKDLSAGTVSSVVITGMVVVFIGLILLIMFVSIYGTIFDKINKRKAAKLTAEKNAKAAEGSAAKADKPAAAAPVIEDGIEEEVVAVIAAAVAAMSAGTGKKLVLKSVRASKPQRSAWASAGIADNTRPF